MTPSIAPPPAEQLAQLMADHAHRFPEKASVDAVGDGGVDLLLPLLLANPTGSVKDPRGALPFPAWETFVALTIGARTEGAATVADEMTRDCIVFPERGLLAQWEERWPAIVSSIGVIVFRRFGTSPSCVRDPRPGEEPTDATKALLAADARGCWRVLEVVDQVLQVVITPPTLPHWTAFNQEKKREGSKPIELIDEMIRTCAKGDGLASLLVKRGGVVLPLYNAIARIAGAAADARLGGW